MARRKRKTRAVRRGRRKNPALLVVRNPSGRRRRRRRAPASRELRRGAARRRHSAAGASGLALARRSRVTEAELLELAKRDKQFATALARYRKFHGGLPDRLTVEDIPVKNPGFRYAVVLGDTRAHEYEAPRSSGRGDGPPFRHNFKRGRQSTATDPWGRGLYVLRRKGSRLRVTDRGIRDD